MTQKQAAAWILGLSSFCLCLSLFAEHILNQPPCALCLAQRTLHLCLALAALAAISLPALSSLSRLVRKACLAILLMSFAVASYHTLVQWKIVEDRCKARFTSKTVAAYKDFLSRASCSENGWKIGPIPASRANGAASLGFYCLLLRTRR